MTVKYVQFSSSKKTKIISEFDSPQSKDDYKYQGEIDSNDPLYLEYVSQFASFFKLTN